MIRFSLLSVIVLMAACSKPEPAAESTAAQTGGESTDVQAERLTAHHWRLVAATDANGARIEALFPNAEQPIQLDFVDGRISVSNACNNISGSYTLAGGTLTLSQLISTRMACEGPLMRAETAISGALHGALQARMEGAATLVLTTAASQTLRFEGTPTADTRFGGPGERVFLEVAPQRVACDHPGMAAHQCLSVRELRLNAVEVLQPAGEWHSLGQDIEGYTFEPGVRNVLRLTRYTVANPPADGSSLAYVLDMVVESETVTP